MAQAKVDTESILRELMRDRADEVVKIALAARRAVLEAAGACCELIYEVYCISDAFSFTGKQGQGFIHIATYAQHVNLGFDHGSALMDPDGLLQGTGKRIRHIRLSQVADLRREPVLHLVEQAVAQGLAMAKEKGGIVPARVVVSRRSS